MTRALMCQAKVSLENREYGEEVGRLKVALDLAREVKDVANKSKAQVSGAARERRVRWAAFCRRSCSCAPFVFLVCDTRS